MDVFPRRFPQSKSGGCALPLNFPSENWSQREMFEPDPRCRARTENGSTGRGRETEQESARTVRTAASEMKDRITKDPVKTRGNDGRWSRGAVHPVRCDRQGSAPREKSKRPPHHVQESADADLDPDETAEDLVSVSPFPQLERTEASGRTGSQTVGVMPGEESDAAPIPVRITPRAHEVWQTLGSFTVVQTDAALKLPTVMTLPIESSDPEPREKRKKTATASHRLSNIRGADSMLDKAKTRGDAGENGKKHEPGDKRPVNRFPAKGEEIGKKRESRKSSGNIRDGGHRSNRSSSSGSVAGSTGREHEPRGDSTGREREPRGVSTGREREPRGVSTGREREPRGDSTGRKREPRGDSTGREREPRGDSTGRTGKDDLARELSRSSALSERERQRRQRHREKRSAAILAKRDKLMKIYKMDCEAFATVAKQLIAQDASLEERVASAVKKSLQLIGERCLAELKETIAKWDAANVLKKRR
ncbi:uncharacterized protein LOC134355406 [Mobula hypostoma]|uniref:uncharacterized protein LOC134355406 n=1 Tax=Mobula hypostoma TaxID=723540 RepID=UPI002FC3AA9F